MIFSTAAIANGSTIGTKRQHGVNLHDSSPHGINLHDGRSDGINLNDGSSHGIDLNDGRSDGIDLNDGSSHGIDLNDGSSHGVNLPAGDKNHPCCFRHLFLTTVIDARPPGPRVARPLRHRGCTWPCLARGDRRRSSE
jgi:hypothetical protein